MNLACQMSLRLVTLVASSIQGLVWNLATNGCLSCHYDEKVRVLRLLVLSLPDDLPTGHHMSDRAFGPPTPEPAGDAGEGRPALLRLTAFIGHDQDKPGQTNGIA